jgi:DNA repair protein RadC
VIVAHNLLSENLKPSESDVKIVTKIEEAGRLADLNTIKERK